MKRNFNLLYSGLDYLVNNAAFLVFGEATWQTQNQVNRQIQVNMTGPLEVFLLVSQLNFYV